MMKHALRLSARVGIGQLLPLLIVFSPGAMADEERGLVKVFMHTVLVEYAKMAPYLGSAEAFSSEEGKKAVGSSLAQLEKRVQKTPPEPLKRNPGFRITYGLLRDHMSKTKEAFNQGEFEHARMRVNSIGNLCASCHMQSPSTSKWDAFQAVEARTQKASFENAGFLFVIRRYVESLSMFNDLIRSYPSSGLSADQLSEAYRQKLAILARVNRNPDDAISSLNDDLKNKELPVDVKRNVGTWIEAIKKWKKEKSDPAKLKTPDLLLYAEKNLPATLNRRIAPSDPELIGVLRLTGLLYERLYSEPDGPQTQGLLYFLARGERSLAPHYWYSLNEIYLKECITQFPKQPYSKKCYSAYEEGMRERYFGKPLPAGVQQTLDSFKDKI